MNFWLMGKIVEDKTYFSNRYMEAASYWLYAAVRKIWKYGLHVAFHSVLNFFSSENRRTRYARKFDEELVIRRFTDDRFYRHYVVAEYPLADRSVVVSIRRLLRGSI